MNETPTPPLEPDDRFPSGPWLGFFLQPGRPGRSPMELRLTFAKGVIEGEGRDWVGAFVLKGRYDLEDGSCRWTKTYPKRHSLRYIGYNEGKGIWGTWHWVEDPSWKGGFRIWPEAMGDPTVERLAEEADLPAPWIDEPVGVGASEVVTVGACLDRAAGGAG